MRLEARIRRLELVHTDRTGLRPHSPEWRAHWEEKLARIANGEEAGIPGSIPLEIWDAIDA